MSANDDEKTISERAESTETVPLRLSARASRAGSGIMTAEEVEEAEREAEDWARRVNRC